MKNNLKNKFVAAKVAFKVETIIVKKKLTHK